MFSQCWLYLLLMNCFPQWSYPFILPWAVLERPSQAASEHRSFLGSLGFCCEQISPQVSSEDGCYCVGCSPRGAEISHENCWSLTHCPLEWRMVIEVSLGTTDMPQCSTWRDFVSWISSRQLKLREVVCFCRKISTPISKILAEQPEKRRKSGS